MMETTAKISVTTANNEWAVILAGGDGTRLKSLTRHIAGDERPKQFCSVMGGATLLEETQRRAALELAQERTLYTGHSSGSTSAFLCSSRCCHFRPAS